MTQWPGFPSAPDHGTPKVLPTPSCGGRGTTATVNTTMETFFQTLPNCQLFLTCMGCHDAARNTDFIWSIRFNPYHPVTMLRSAERVRAIKELQDLLQAAQGK
jgi:hypothetical protein